MNYIFFTSDGTILPAAFKLKQEGHKVFIGQIQDELELLPNKEMEAALKERVQETIEAKAAREDKNRRRLSPYDGMIEKIPARKLMKALLRVPDDQKQDYSIWFDFNTMWKYSEILLEAGFKNGLFPTSEDSQFEKDRKKAKDFMDQHYPDLKKSEVQEFATSKEGIDFLKDTEEIWVLKSQGDHGGTVVPKTDDIEIARDLVIDALTINQKDYENGGYILEKKICNTTEITPSIFFWNGVPIFSDIDIETKNLGDGNNNGPQVGCGTNLIVATALGDGINKIAFPPIVYEMAKERMGLFIWDISLLIDNDTGDIYGGEFCPNRFGYDAIFSEIVMCSADGATRVVSPFFEKIIQGINPIKRKYGVTVRLFNMRRDEDGRVKEDLFCGWQPECEPWLFLYEVQKDKGRYSTTGCSWDFAVVACAGDDLTEAIKETYRYTRMVVLDDMLKRSEMDFFATDYPQAIMNRLEYVRERSRTTDIVHQKMSEAEKSYAAQIESLQAELTAERELRAKQEESTNQVKDELTQLLLDNG